VNSTMKGVLVLEGIDKDDPGSEGRFLVHMLNLMRVKNQYVEVRTREQLIAMVRTTSLRVIHFSTHGQVSDDEEDFRGLWTPMNILGMNHLHALGLSLKDKLVVSTACRSGMPDFASAFVRQTKCSHYLAPRGKPKWHNAIFFAHLFYHMYFVLKRDPVSAFADYKHRYKNPHGFNLTTK
jgi:hypothetical protein